MRRFYLISVGLLGLTVANVAAAQSAPKPAQSADEIACKLTGDCGDTQLDESAKLDKGDEAAFSFRRSTSSQPAYTAPQRTASATPAMNAGRRPEYSRAVTPTRPRAMTPGAGTTVDMRINFATGSARMDSASVVNAAEFARALMTKPALSGRRVQIQGHTDGVGDRASNLRLSQARAEAVAEYMISLGVPSEQLTAKGYGPDRPLAGQSRKSAANRRVQLVLAN